MYWIIPGRTGLWWDNLRDNKMPANEWRKNLRMNRLEFLNLVKLQFTCREQAIDEITIEIKKFAFLIKDSWKTHRELRFQRVVKFNHV